jgi:hypothetical protein
MEKTDKIGKVPANDVKARDIQGKDNLFPTKIKLTEIIGNY